jgi:hypothetical protein
MSIRYRPYALWLSVRTRRRKRASFIVRLSGDLQFRLGRRFGRPNLFQMRSFYLAYRNVLQTLSGQSIDGLSQTHFATICANGIRRLTRGLASLRIDYQPLSDPWAI